MKAEKMFEKLGYKKRITDFGIFYERGDILRYTIHFNINTKRVSLDVYNSYDLAMESFTMLPEDYMTLNAIKKQLRELGWRKPRTKIKILIKKEVINYD